MVSNQGIAAAESKAAPVMLHYYNRLDDRRRRLSFENLKKEGMGEREATKGRTA